MKIFKFSMYIPFEITHENQPNNGTIDSTPTKAFHLAGLTFRRVYVSQTYMLIEINACQQYTTLSFLYHRMHFFANKNVSENGTSFTSPRLLLY